MAEIKLTSSGDVTNRLVMIFEHPKSDPKNPSKVMVYYGWFLMNGPPKTEKGKPWKYVATHLIQ